MPELLGHLKSILQVLNVWLSEMKHKSLSAQKQEFKVSKVPQVSLPSLVKPLESWAVETNSVSFGNFLLCYRQKNCIFRDPKFSTAAVGVLHLP